MININSSLFQTWELLQPVEVGAHKWQTFLDIPQFIMLKTQKLQKFREQ